MLYRETHDKFARRMFPWINPKLTSKVNHQIDSPTLWQMYMNSMMNRDYKVRGLVKNPYDIFSLTGSGHRKYNHDILTGSLLGSIQAMKMGMPPSHGMMTAFAHYATDSLSNKMVQTMGVEGRNIMEALIGLNSRRYDSRRQRRGPIPGWF